MKKKCNKILGILVLAVLWISSSKADYHLPKDCGFGNAVCEIGTCDDGYGLLKFTNGESIEGNFKNCKYDGEMTLYYEDRTKQKLEFENGNLARKYQTVNISNAEIIIPVNVIILKFDENNIDKIKGERESVFYPVGNNIKEINIDIKTGKKTVKETSIKEYIDEIKKDFDYTNHIWRDTGIYWNLISVNVENANEKGINYKKLKSTKFTDKKFSKDIKKLVNIKKNQNKKALNVYYLPSYHLVKAAGLAFREKNLDNWFIIMKLNKNKINHRTLAHELGHLLNLDHNQSTKSLMGHPQNKFYKALPYGVNIQSNEAIKAKKFYRKYWDPKFK